MLVLVQPVVGTRSNQKVLLPEHCCYVGVVFLFVGWFIHLPVSDCLGTLLSEAAAAPLSARVGCHPHAVGFIRICVSFWTMLFAFWLSFRRPDETATWPIGRCVYVFSWRQLFVEAAISATFWLVFRDGRCCCSFIRIAFRVHFPLGMGGSLAIFRAIESCHLIEGHFLLLSVLPFSFYQLLVVGTSSDELST